MKVLILAGGFGTRLSEATNLMPKPMVEIGGKPILWHIMKTYSSFGYNDWNKSYVYFKNLPKLAKTINELEKKVDGHN